MVPLADSVRADRLAAVVGGVVRTAVESADATGVVVLHDGSPAARLARDWCAAALGADAVWTVARPDHDAAAPFLDAEPDPAAVEEVHRFTARRLAVERGALTVAPANKTALLLGDRTPPEPLLPLGDLYARQVQELTGGWSAPPPVPDLARRAGGIERLDGALRALFDERRRPDEALGHLPDAAADAVLSALDRGRFGRRHVIGLVPKLSVRTLGIDLLA